MILYVDGGCSGNERRDIAARKTVMVVTDEAGTVLSERLGKGGSNNIAELEAVRDALAWCADQRIAAVEIRTDSRNNFAWIYGRKLGKSLNDRDRVLTLQEEIAIHRRRVQLSLVWVPREQNKAGHYIEARHGL